MRARQSGNVMFALFAAAGMVGVLGATAMTVMKGPVKAMHNVTQRTIAENSMIASGKLALMWAGTQMDGGDCDGDGATEPPPWAISGTGPMPTGGGYLPSNIGAALLDPWGNTYGYCSWDHGSSTQKTTPAPTCPTPMQRLQGASDSNGVVVAIISSGPDKVFQTSCGNAPTYVTRVSGSDDVILSYTFGEAEAQSAGLWKLKSGTPTTAEIGDRDIEIKGSSGADTARIGYDADLGKAGVGDFLALRVNEVYAKEGNDTVAFQDLLRLKNVTGLAAPTSGTGGGGGAAPTGAVMAFDLASCPSGWTEYLPARGRFIRGIDSTGTNDTTRAAGNIQADANKSHTHTGSTATAGAHSHSFYTSRSNAGVAGQVMGTNYGYNDAAGATLTAGDHAHSLTINADGASEARPKNVALLYCRKD